MSKIKIIPYNSIYYSQVIELYIESLNNNFIYSQLNIDKNEIKEFVKNIIDNSLLDCAILAINHLNQVVGFSIVDDWCDYRSRKSLVFKDSKWNIARDFIGKFLNESDQFLIKNKMDPKKVVYGTYSGVSASYNGDNLFQKMVTLQINLLSKVGYTGLIAIGSHPATSLMHLKSYKDNLALPIHELLFESYEFNGLKPLSNPRTKNIPVRASYWAIEKNPAPILLRSKL